MTYITVHGVQQVLVLPVVVAKVKDARPPSVCHVSEAQTFF